MEVIIGKQEYYLGIHELKDGTFMLATGSGGRGFVSYSEQSKSKYIFNKYRFESIKESDPHACVAHNLCVLSAKDCVSIGNTLAYAIGGQYEYDTFKEGIFLVEYGADHKWRVKQKLVDGNHPGGIELRSGFDNACEFDGVSCMVFYREMWHLFCRANLRKRGYRSVQVCKGKTLDRFGPFQQICVDEHDDVNNIYFAFVYRTPRDRLMAVCSVVYTNAVRGVPNVGGTYVCFSDDGVHFSKMILLDQCPCDGSRTRDMPIAGCTWEDDHTFEIGINRNIPGRTSMKKEPQVLTWHRFKIGDECESVSQQKAQWK